ncbi:MAG: 4Fe-4S binding protein [Thermoguttaceae bacterium]|jgi:formate hydrogenlyase subunit 6/NADH:ubiquinone oxidoreductase subunit I
MTAGRDEGRAGDAKTAARPAPRRRKVSGTLLARRTVQVVCLLAFLGLLLAAQVRPDGTTPAVWKTFFLVDPLVLAATWLAAHAMPLALFALPALAAALLVVWLAGRRVSAMGVLVAAVWITLAGIVASAAVGHLGVPALLLVALGTVAVTAVLGRVFCGWVCPLGTLHALASRLLLPAGKGRVVARSSDQDVVARSPDRATPVQDPWSPWQKAKYYLLAGMLLMALVGGHWGTIFDPLVLLYRTTTTALGPAARWAVEEGSTAVVHGEEALEGDAAIGPGSAARHPLRPSSLTEPVYGFLRDNVFRFWGTAYLGTGLIVGLLAVTLGLNAYRRRFWCRYLCPLGALLGVISWRPLVRRGLAAEKCNGCDLCGRTCHGAAAAGPGQGWMAPECLGCFHCTAACPRTAIGFQWSLPWRMPSGGKPVDLSKRAALASAFGGLVAMAFLRATPQGRGRAFHPRLLRPPGSRDEPAFLASCTACGMCMKVCPTGGLQPAWSEAGLEGLWTPRLVPQIGHCDYTCNLCGQICPTEAIRPLDIEAKQQTRIGLASFDTSRCIPYACGRDCGVCEEHCPIPDKAIYYVEVEVQDHDGNKRTVKQPRVDPRRCIGCGQCENVCVYKDRPAVRVFSANETRHPNNQPILADDDPYAGSS